VKHILTLCAGNICRSPIAAALLAREFPDKTVLSAGLGALVGHPADPLSVEVAAAHGLDVSAHRAMQLSAWMCQSADLILVMEEGQKTELEQKYP
jgi:protein-tyrosine phosphatase